MKPSYIIVHHTGAEEKDAEQVKRYHLSLGWRDVGYNYIIERSGRVVKGRSLDIPGAHCRAGDMNRHSIGVAVIGNLDEHPPLPEQRRALVDLLRILACGHDIQVENILGHREVPGAATACPGRYLDMAQVRRELVECTETKPDTSAPGCCRAANEPEPSPLWRVQVGAFSTRTRAENYARQLRQRGIDAFLVKVNE